MIRCIMTLSASCDRGVGYETGPRLARVENISNRPTAGPGLAICRSIIEAHDGRIWAAPNRSQGAVFHLILPAQTPA
jgi:K+-sensing histidine kinase KdpD